MTGSAGQPLLSSIETEYAIAGYGPEKNRIDPGLMSSEFMLAAESCITNLPTSVAELFLANGGKLHVDMGVHPEYAAPECAGHPSELIAYIHAGDEIINAVCRKIEGAAIPSVLCFRSNVDYATRSTWGCHENYLSRLSVHHHCKNLYPFLAARPILGGAGGFVVNSYGLRFNLAPRLMMFKQDIGSPSTDERPVIHTRNERLAKDYYRIHIICRENLNSEIADKVMIGLMRLIIHLGELGISLAENIRIASPLRTMLDVCRSPFSAGSRSAVINAATGKRMYAIDIINHYLDIISLHLKQLPDWAEEIITDTRFLIDRLETDPSSLVGILDWPTKKFLFESCLSGRTLDELEKESALVDQVASFCDLERHKPLCLTSEIVLDTITSRHIEQCHDLLKPKGGVKWLDEFADLRGQLLQLDTMFSDVSRTSWKKIRQPEERVVSDQDILRAVQYPPDSTRAKLRGRFVQAHAGKRGFTVSWTSIKSSKDRKTMDLGDPFERREIWRSLPKPD